MHKKQPVVPKNISFPNQNGKMRWASKGQVPTQENTFQGALSIWLSKDHVV